MKNRNAVVTFYPDLSRSISRIDPDSDSDTDEYYSLSNDIEPDSSCKIDDSKINELLPGHAFYVALEKLIKDSIKSTAVEHNTTQSKLAV